MRRWLRAEEFRRWKEIGGGEGGGEIGDRREETMLRGRGDTERRNKRRGTRKRIED